MARALVVYESMSGNTRTVAAAVAAGLGTRVTARLLEVREAPRVLPTGVDLLVVGAPTQGRHGTTALREWLARLGPLPPYVTAATFATKAATPKKVPGSAARTVRRQLARRGIPVVARPKTFYLDGTTGPLLPGEEQRARAWGAGLADNLTESRRVTSVG